MRKFLLVTESLFGVVDRTFPKGAAAASCKLEVVIVEEATFHEAWLSEKNIEARDAVVLAMDVRRNVRLFGEDGRYAEVMHALQSRGFTNIFVLTVGASVQAPNIEVPGVAAERVFHLGLDEARDGAIEDSRTLGARGAELVAKIEADVLQHLGRSTLAERSARRLTLSRNSVSLVILIGLALFGLASSLGLCTGSVEAMQRFTVFNGTLVVPDALVAPACSVADLLSLLEKNATAELGSIKDDLRPEQMTKGERFLDRARTDVNAVHARLPSQMSEIAACEQQHRLYARELASFYGAASALPVRRDVVMPEKCLLLGRSQFRIPKFLSNWL